MVMLLIVVGLAVILGTHSLRLHRNAMGRSSVKLHAEIDVLVSKITANNSPGQIVVIKYGGHAMENDEYKKYFCEDVATLAKTGILPVIIHGGGPQIAKMLTSLNIESRFVQGLRVTDQKTMEVAQMVLCGALNKEICGLISSHAGIRGAVGLCGLDGKLVSAKIIKKKYIDASGQEQIADLGLVGDPTTINVAMIRDLLSIGLIPVIAPVAYNEEGGGSLNINADTAAGAIAESLKADRLLLLTDVTGVLDKQKKLMTVIPSDGLQALVADGTITGGMIPKLETATQAVNAGVGSVSIVDGRVRHSILTALSGEESGTVIKKV